MGFRIIKGMGLWCCKKGNGAATHLVTFVMI